MWNRTRVIRRWARLGVVTASFSMYTGCLGVLQNELEVIFAFEAVGNAQLLPLTVIAQVLLNLIQ